MTAEERIELLRPMKECEYAGCRKKFRAKTKRERWCSPECRKKDNARIQREKRHREKEEAEEFKKEEKKTKPSVPMELMTKLMRKNNLSYGKVEEAIQFGRIKVE